MTLEKVKDYLEIGREDHRTKLAAYGAVAVGSSALALYQMSEGETYLFNRSTEAALGASITANTMGLREYAKEKLSEEDKNREYSNTIYKI